MSGGGPNSPNRCTRSGTLGAAISVLLLFVLDTNATNTLDKSESPTRTILYINGRGMRPGNARLAPSNAGSSPSGPESSVVGTYEPDANHAGVRPLDTTITAQERERLGKQGAALIEGAVKAMDVKGVVQALRDEDQYVREVIIPKYGGVLPK